MRALIDLATRRRLPPRLVMALIYLGGASGFLVVYARGANMITATPTRQMVAPR